MLRLSVGPSGGAGRLAGTVKCIRFLPFTFVAGIDGFDLFAPYAALVLTLVPLLKRLRRLSVAEAGAVETSPPDLPGDLVPAAAK